MGSYFPMFFILALIFTAWLAFERGKSSKQDEELSRYPKIKRAYLKAFERMLKARRERGLKTRWENAEQVYDWWIGKATT